MVAMCPLCNGLNELDMNCSNCGTLMTDLGKVSDFLDPYGHYNDEETVKMGDGYPNTAQDQICPHLMSCKHCSHDKVVFIQEQ
jgi:DNA-directed RNA polymerase subunit M/transcription elongation factor TFIIS